MTVHCITWCNYFFALVNKQGAESSQFPDFILSPNVVTGKNSDFTSSVVAKVQSIHTWHMVLFYLELYLSLFSLNIEGTIMKLFCNSNTYITT